MLVRVKSNISEIYIDIYTQSGCKITKAELRFLVSLAGKLFEVDTEYMLDTHLVLKTPKEGKYRYQNLKIDCRYLDTLGTDARIGRQFCPDCRNNFGYNTNIGTLQYCKVCGYSGELVPYIQNFKQEAYKCKLK